MPPLLFLFVTLQFSTMSAPNPILNATNGKVKVTNLYGGTPYPAGLDSFHGMPIGTVGDSPTGEVLLKVSVREGGGGGGGGGAVTIANGADVAEGNTADAAVAAGAAGTVSAKLRTITTQLAAATPAGSNIIGKVGIDQTAGQNLVQLTGTQLTPVSELDTDGGTVAAGKKHIEFIFSSDYTGDVNGIAYTGSADAVQTFDAPPGYTLAAIIWTTTAGSVRVISY